MPQTVVTLAMLNAIRDSASTAYVDTIPAATRTNIAAIGTALLTFPALLNEFTGTLVTKIALTIFNQKIAINRLAPFKSGLLPFGATVEEIFIEQVNSVVYDPAGANPLGRRKPTNVKVMYHTQNRQSTYEISVSDVQIKSAFRSAAGVQSLVAGIIQSMYSGANDEEYIFMKNLLATYTDDATHLIPQYKDYEVAPITDTATATDFVKAVRKAAQDMSFMSNQYNSAGVKTYCMPEDCVLLVNKDILVEIDTEVLAHAFNMDKTTMQGKIVSLDDFGSLPNTEGILMDKEFFKVYDTLNQVESIRNPQGMFTTYFLQIWQILSLSRFKNAVRFVRQP